MTFSLLSIANESSGKRSINSQETTHSLRNAFIKVIGTRCGPNHPTDFCLTREGFEKPIAVARIGKDGTVTLNPSGFYYGDIPKLELMTPITAAQLWSSTGQDKSTNGEQSYQLKNFLNDTFKIDLQFKNNKLLKYRVRSNCPFQKKEAWFSVQREN